MPKPPVQLDYGKDGAEELPRFPSSWTQVIVFTLVFMLLAVLLYIWLIWVGSRAF